MFSFSGPDSFLVCRYPDEFPPQWIFAYDLNKFCHGYTSLTPDYNASLVLEEIMDMDADLLTMVLAIVVIVCIQRDNVGSGCLKDYRKQSFAEKGKKRSGHV